MKKRVKTAKGRSKSSTKWLQRQLNDPYVKLAKQKGYRSRAVFKILEIDEKLNIFKGVTKVLDLGAAPGGWSQYATEKVSGKENNLVLAVDLLEIDPLPNVTTIQGNFTHEEIQQQITEIVEQTKGGFDLVVSDMAPSTTGHQQTDHLRIMGLVDEAVYFADKYLNKGGNFLSKVFMGGGEKDLEKQLKQMFETVRFIKPKSSRDNSAEQFIYAENFLSKNLQEEEPN